MRSVLIFDDTERAINMEAVQTDVSPGVSMDRILDAWAHQYEDGSRIQDCVSTAKSFYNFVKTNGYLRAGAWPPSVAIDKLVAINPDKVGRPDQLITIRCAPGEGIVVVVQQEEH